VGCRRGAALQYSGIISRALVLMKISQARFLFLYNLLLLFLCFLNSPQIKRLSSVIQHQFSSPIIAYGLGKPPIKTSEFNFHFHDALYIPCLYSDVFWEFAYVKSHFLWMEPMTVSAQKIFEK
jgi:hypothetical protein